MQDNDAFGLALGTSSNSPQRTVASEPLRSISGRSAHLIKSAVGWCSL
ncbi:hypothetical protein ACFPIJ_11670 [Dactylosporangium cerinum]|uniref:Uncharacterized protein n=1 Tax=Dactylosporangium cerinum TaxID=1434730 RepID=A0ABV9VR58_9ACTN